MKALHLVLAIAAAAVFATATAGASTKRQPAIKAVGNDGVCSLSTHKTFRLKLTGWKPGATVQLKLYYGNGQNYPFALRNGGKIQVNSHGSHLGPPWPCWPNKTYNVADKKTYYIVFAFQLDSTPLANATTVFRVVK